MVIKNVSSSSEPPILKMVRMLRRLLRNAFLLTKRGKVMIELLGKTLPACGGPTHRLKHNRWPAEATTSCLPNHSMARGHSRYQWRSSLGRNDKCHPGHRSAFRSPL